MWLYGLQLRAWRRWSRQAATEWWKAERESVREGGTSRSPKYSARPWFIWQLFDGGLSMRGHLHQCLTSDPLHLLTWTLLSSLNLHADGRDELLLGRTQQNQQNKTHKHTHAQVMHRCVYMYQIRHIWGHHMNMATYGRHRLHMMEKKEEMLMV